VPFTNLDQDSETATAQHSSVGLDLRT
jgi:hypothetical protein